jgi:HSP20 family molecular chaperone IbpA
MVTPTTSAKPVQTRQAQVVTPAPRDMPERSTRTVSPPVDIFETDRAYVLLADMPGVGPDGLEVVAERNTLTIRGRVARQETIPDYQEFELADYYRAFTLTEDLEIEGIAAALRDGVLRVEIPKSPRVQPKKIPVRTE